MLSPVVVRGADLRDVPALARVHVDAWRETYRGVMRDDVLDDPGFVSRREHFWTTVLADDRYGERGVAVAERDGDVVGLALAGPPSEAGTTWTTQLYALYTLAAVHGSGAAVPGSAHRSASATARSVPDPSARPR